MRTNSTDSVAKEMGTFSIRKIANIRSDLDNHSPQVCRVDFNDSEIDLPLSKFDFLSQEEVHDLICTFKRKTCSLDPRFLQNLFSNA